jgi:hypothetical protein
MIQKYAFTTAAMSAALEDTPVSYEDLAEIEKDFDDVETEISTLFSLVLHWRGRAINQLLFALGARRPLPMNIYDKIIAFIIGRLKQMDCLS